MKQQVVEVVTEADAKTGSELVAVARVVIIAVWLVAIRKWEWERGWLRVLQELKRDTGAETVQVSVSVTVTGAGAAAVVGAVNISVIAKQRIAITEQ